MAEEGPKLSRRNLLRGATAAGVLAAVPGIVNAVGETPIPTPAGAAGPDADTAKVAGLKTAIAEGQVRNARKTEIAGIETTVAALNQPPTSTRKPTETAKPTDTPKPTNTPKPTETATPTDTPKPPTPTVTPDLAAEAKRRDDLEKAAVQELVNRKAATIKEAEQNQTPTTTPTVTGTATQTSTPTQTPTPTPAGIGIEFQPSESQPIQIHGDVLKIVKEEPVKTIIAGAAGGLAAAVVTARSSGRLRGFVQRVMPIRIANRIPKPIKRIFGY